LETLFGEVEGNNKLQILASFADRERGHLRAVLFDEGAHPRRVGLAVVAQRPADRLVDEELRLELH